MIPIVVTGLGLVTPLGVGVDAVWEPLIAGQNGIRSIDPLDVSDLATQFAGLEPDIADDPAGWM